MKPKLKIESKYKNLLKNTKNHSFSSLFKEIQKEKDNNAISKFITSHNIFQDTNNTQSKETTNDNNNTNTKTNLNKIINTPNISSSEKKFHLNLNDIHQHDNRIISNSFFNNKNTNKNSRNINTKKFNTSSNNKNIYFPLAFVELKNPENEKKNKIFLTESNKKKKKININLKEENKSFLRKNKIINDFYTDYMQRKKNKELIESKLFKQKLIWQFMKYSPNYMRKYRLKIEENILKDREKLYLEQMKSENNLTNTKYNDFKKKITKRLTKGNINIDNENSNLFINSIYNYLYKNIMNYEGLIDLLNKFKGKIPLNFAKMISEFLSLKFNCFKKIKNEYGGQIKLIKLCDYLKVEKFKKGDIIYDIDTYEKNYYLLLKGNIDVYQIFYVIEEMKIKEFIKYLKEIKDNNFIFKLYRIIQKNIIENTYDKFDVIEQILNGESIDKNERINLSEINKFFIEEMKFVGNKEPGDNINNDYYDEQKYNNVFDNKKRKNLRNSLPDFVKEFFKDKENRIFYKTNFSDKKYICLEDCYLVSIEKEILEKKIQDMDMKLFGENADMFLLYSYIFKNWEKETINSIIKNYFNKKCILHGEYLYQQNDISDKIYIVLRGEFSQYISFNTKRIQEIKNYISFNKDNIFTLWKNRFKKSIIKEEIEEFFLNEEKTNGDFPFEIKDKKNNNIEKISKFNIKYYLKKKKKKMK